MSLFVFNEVIVCHVHDEKLGGTASLCMNLVPSNVKGRGFFMFYAEYLRSEKRWQK